MVVNAVKAIINIAGGAPQMANRFGPFPGLVIAPFANAENYWSSGSIKSIAHGKVSSVGVQFFGIAPVVFQIVYSPTGVLLCILEFISTASGTASAGFPSGIGINSQF